MADTYECEICGNIHEEDTDCPYVIDCVLDCNNRGIHTDQALTQKFSLGDFETGMYGLDQESWDILALGADYIEVEEGDLKVLESAGWGHLKVGEQINVQMPEELWEIYAHLGETQDRERIITNESYLDVANDLPDPMWLVPAAAERLTGSSFQGVRSYYLQVLEGSYYLMWREIEGAGDENDVRNPNYEESK